MINSKGILFVLLVIVISMVLGVFLGMNAKQTQIRNRVLTVNKTKPLTNSYYSQLELEYIVFGEPQL